MSDNDQTVRITLRIPADLHEQLTKAAAQDNRSMNAEIIHRLQYTLDPVDSSAFTISVSEEDIREQNEEALIHHSGLNAAREVLRDLANALEAQNEDATALSLAKAIKTSLNPPRRQFTSPPPPPPPPPPLKKRP